MTTQGGPASGEVLQKTPIDVPLDPFKVFIIRWKVRNHQERKFRKKSTHVRDQAAVEFVSA